MPKRNDRWETADRFRANLQLAMETHGVTAVELSKRSGVSVRMIHAILRRENRPTVDVADALGEALGYSGWVLLLPTFQPALGVREVAEDYMTATQEDREIASRVLKRGKKAS